MTENIGPEPILLRARHAFAEVIEARGLADAPIEITTRTLTTEEAVGEPIYDDLPILRGKEVMIEAEFRGAKGHAFTSSPSSWSGSLHELLALPVETNRQRALLSAAMNAVLRSLGLVECTVHCLSQDITRCGKQIAVDLRHEFGPIPVGVVGYQPGLVAGLVEEFGPDLVRVTDLLEENLGRRVHGLEIWDGLTCTEDLVRSSRLVLATGSTAANNTLDSLLSLTQEAGVPLLLFGVTAAAVCYLCGLRRICLLAS
jgi:uncharacterized protein (DUF4213/DUF364 family)